MTRGMLQVIGGIYLAIGVLHSIYFSFSITRSACMTAKGLVYVFCNTGLGVSHFVVTLGWPFYWL